MSDVSHYHDVQQGKSRKDMSGLPTLLTACICMVCWNAEFQLTTSVTGCPSCTSRGTAEESPFRDVQQKICRCLIWSTMCVLTKRDSTNATGQIREAKSFNLLSGSLIYHCYGQISALIRLSLPKATLLRHWYKNGLDENGYHDNLTYSKIW